MKDNEKIVIDDSGFSYKPCMMLGAGGMVYKRSLTGELLYQFKLNGVKLGNPRPLDEVQTIAKWFSEVDWEDYCLQRSEAECHDIFKML